MANGKGKAKVSKDKNQDKRIRKLENEMKAQENQVSYSNNAGIPTGGLMYPLTAIVVGDVEGDRTSTNTVIKRLSLDIQISRGTNDSFVRCMVFKSKDSAGALPTQAQLIQVPASAISPMSQIAYLNRLKFTKVWEGHVSLNAISPQHWFRVRKNFKGAQLTTYLDATANNSSLGQNQYYLYMDSSQAAGVGAPVQTYVTTVTYEE